MGKKILDPGRLGNHTHDVLPEVQERLPFPKCFLYQLEMLQEVSGGRIALLD